jgi:phosphoglycolate phosphatase
MPDLFEASLSRRWDRYDAYLFDIDGTMITSDDAVHYFAFCDALEMLSGRPLNLDGVIAHGNTDVGILRDALALAGVAESIWRPRRDEACAAMGRFVAERRSELRVRVLPGVRGLLEHLRERGAVLGVATGNLATIGRLKLESVGLLAFFRAGSYSDALETRSAVFRRALASVREVAGVEAAVCVLGDTPEDVRAARANGLEVIAVATGIYSFEELAAERPHACCRELTDLLASGD